MTSQPHAHVTPNPARGPRFNALKHGRYAESILLPGDDPVQYRRERRALFHNYRPQTKDEADLVAMMAESQWGLRRYYPLQRKLDDQALSPETDAAERVAEPITHERLHSGMDVTVQRQRLSRMWHRARGGLSQAQKMRSQGLVAGAVKLPKDCYMEVDGKVYGPVVQPEIAPIPEPEIEADNIAASGSIDGEMGIRMEQKENAGQAAHVAGQTSPGQSKGERLSASAENTAGPVFVGVPRQAPWLDDTSSGVPAYRTPGIARTDPSSFTAAPPAPRPQGGSW